jgi:hypothetical protein
VRLLIVVLGVVALVVFFAGVLLWMAAAHDTEREG